MASVDQLFSDQLKFDLRPLRARHHSVYTTIRDIVPGDHIAILERCGVHHGLYLGPLGGKYKVAEFCRHKDCLRVTDYTAFVEGKRFVYVVPYNNDHDKARVGAIELANFTTEVRNPILETYRGCESFVFVCKTGKYQDTEYIKTLLKWVNDSIHSSLPETSYMNQSVI